MMAALLWELFSTFFVIGLFNFGGGGAMLSLIQNEVVLRHAWLSEEAFTNIVAISQSTPGPIGINCATYVGYEVLHDAGFGSAVSILGSAATTLALVLPSLLVFFVVIRLFNRFHKHPVFSSTMKALSPAVAGMIAAAALVLMLEISWRGGFSIRLVEENFADWKQWLLFVTAFLLAYFKNVSPITLLAAAGITGLIIY